MRDRVPVCLTLSSTTQAERCHTTILPAQQMFSCAAAYSQPLTQANADMCFMQKPVGVLPTDAKSWRPGIDPNLTTSVGRTTTANIPSA